MRGIPTVLITVSPEVSAQMRPPRALYPKGFKPGNSLGRPHMRELQRSVLRDALRDLKAEGFVREVAAKHIGYMGYTMQLKAMYEGTAPQIANEIDRGSRADAVILTGG